MRVFEELHVLIGFWKGSFECLLIKCYILFQIAVISVLETKGEFDISSYDIYCFHTHTLHVH